jgi:general secretion pathway protein G
VRASSLGRRFASNNREANLRRRLLVHCRGHLLAALFSVDSFSSMNRARPVAAKAQIAALFRALDVYRSDVGDFPTEAQGLEALQQNPGVEGWNGPYLKQAVPKDPWGAPYGYRVAAGRPEVVPLGGGSASGTLER